jgi:hypothetical protein
MALYSNREAASPDSSIFGSSHRAVAISRSAMVPISVSSRVFTSEASGRDKRQNSLPRSEKPSKRVKKTKGDDDETEKDDSKSDDDNDETSSPPVSPPVEE